MGDAAVSPVAYDGQQTTFLQVSEKIKLLPQTFTLAFIFFLVKQLTFILNNAR